MVDEFAIRPPDGALLQVRRLLGALAEHPAVVRLRAALYSVSRSPEGRAPEDVYVVCATPAQAGRVAKAAEEGLSLEPFVGSVAFIEVMPRHVTVHQAAPGEVLDHVAALLVPFIREQPCRIFVEDGEATASYADRPETLFQ